MKGQYNIYPLFTEVSSRQVRKGLHKKLSNQQCLKYLFAEVPDMTQTLNYTILSEEHFWMERSRVVIFPESTDILDRLREAKFSISKSSGIQFPHKCFLLAFPKDFKIAGHQAHGCMISYMDRTDRFDQIHIPFFKWLGFGIPVFADDRYTRGLYFSYFSPLQTDTLIRACIPTEIIADCLQAKTPHDYGVIVGNFSRDKIKDFIALDENDLKYQFELFQIVARIGVYATSCDNALREGYPHVRPKHLEPKGLKYIDYSLTAATESRTVGAHYRSWYFRQLNNKKYYQGEHKHKPIGSRIVFVKDTMVSLNVEAETLT